MSKLRNPIMADEQNPIFQIQRMYLKDLSLEQPNSPQILLEQQAPQVDINLAMGAESVADGIFEVAVTATVTAKVKDKVLFLVEAKQGGIFEMRGIPNEQFDAIVGIVCPGIVYPYLRANIADLINRTGLPPIHLAEINFEAMYQQRVAQQQGAGLIVPPGTATKQ